MRAGLIRTAVAAALVAGVLIAPRAEAGAPPPTAAQALPGLDYWTEPGSTSVFRETVPTKQSGRAIDLDAARNEEESAQIVLRSPGAFRINGLSFSALTSGANTIAATSLSYTFLTYKHLNRNTKFFDQQLYPVVRVGEGDYPDPLSNARAIDVPARSSQSIWLTVAVPKTAQAGRYSGSATVSTSKGDFQVPVSVDVRAVTLPDSKDGVFENTLWSTFFGELSWAPDGRTIEETFKYERYTPQYWALLEKVAVQMKRHRTNTLTLPLVNLLLDGNTTVTDNSDATGRYTFDWTRIDQLIEFFVARGVVKRLEGFWVSADTYNWGRPQDDIREVEIADRPQGGSGDAQRNYVDWNSAKANNFIDQFIPALKQHLDAKGWTQSLKYWMHVGDEPGIEGGEEEKAWRGILARMRLHWPDVKVGDAAVHEPVASNVSREMAVMIPNLLNYDGPHQATYDQLRAQGKDLYFYNCNIPVGNYLNRFIDQPQFNQRLTGWYAYSRNANGYLHYSMNGWLASLDAEEPKGDHYIVWPDVPNNTIESSIRYESLRDGIEDYETLAILGRTNPGLARDLATALTQRADKYSPDTGYQARIRELVLDAAAGRVSADIARGAAATTSSAQTGHGPESAVDGRPDTSWRPSGTGEQYLQVYLRGKQGQVDGVKLNWSDQFATNYRVEISYNGNNWATAFSTTTGNGGDDFIGLNSKVQAVRLVIPATTSPYGLDSVEFLGQVLERNNLLGGRPYTVSPTPNNKPDSGRESSDGLLADAHDDGRTYGFAAGQPTATVTFDLGSTQAVDSARIHAYEEYPAYRPDMVTIATSTDGVNYQQKGRLPVVNDQTRTWYEFDFPASLARYVKVTFQKTYGGDGEVMLIDEIELYEAKRQPADNKAAGKTYTKDPAPNAGYPDAANRESTDGVIAGAHPTGLDYGYNIPVGTTGRARVTVDLGSEQAIGSVAAKEHFDNVTQYGPDMLRVFAGNSPTALTQVGQAGVPAAQWFTVGFPAVTARYVQVEFEKFSVGEREDWIFVDEIAVYPPS